MLNHPLTLQGEVKMKKMIEKILNNYEKHFPHHRELNDMAHNDLIDAKGELQPARGIALNSGY